MCFTEFMSSQEELSEASQFTGYGKHKGVLTRTITRAEREKKEQEEADKKAMKDMRAASKPAPIDLWAVARSIEAAVGNSIPDGDPIDPLIRQWARKVKEGEFMPLLNRATKKHLGAKTYHEYVADNWDTYAEMDGEGTEDRENPWR